MMAAPTTFVSALAIVLSGCAAPTPEPMPSITAASVRGPEALHTPGRVVPGRLEYAPSGSTFAPILTERFFYPTEVDANAAHLRLIGMTTAGRPLSGLIRLFGCKPGALNPQTARVTRYHGPVVHCATDLLDGDGRTLRRETANFYYHRSVWTIQPLDPPQSPVAWRDRERSPRDLWWWLPGRSRYQ